MAQFLNTIKLNYWIPKLIREAEKEIVLIVPYIKTSDDVFMSLKAANDKGIDIILIYKENKLSDNEKQKLLSLTNLNLLYHPNIHCKCYFNGNLLILGSMNLYDYSEKNNREMGVLFSSEEIYNEPFLSNNLCFPDDNDIFLDAITEIREIVNGSSPEKVTERIKSRSFDVDIIKTNEEFEVDRCQELNNYFLNKKFKPFENSKHEWFSRCDNFYDKIDVVFQEKRVAIHINICENDLKELHLEWMKTYNEYEFMGFKYYWNKYTDAILLYQDKNFDGLSLEKDSNLRYEKIGNGIGLILKKFRSLTCK